MKKKLIYSSALAALISASSIALAGGPEVIPVEDYFSGFYVGGTGSVHHVDFDGSNSVNFSGFNPLLNPALAAALTPGVLASNDSDGASIDGYGGIQGGFGWTFNHVWYLGVQGFGEWGSQSQTNSSTSGPITTLDASGLISSTSTTNTTTTLKLSNDYGVAGKIGYVVAPRTLVYGKVGASWANLKVTNSASTANILSTGPTVPGLISLASIASGSSNTQNNQIGLLLGIGFEQFVYQDLVSINVEYDYVNYGSVSTGPVSLVGSSTLSVIGVPVSNTGAVFLPVTTSATASAKVNSLLGGINFYFGRNWF